MRDLRNLLHDVGADGRADLLSPEQVREITLELLIRQTAALEDLAALLRETLDESAVGLRVRVREDAT